MVYSPDSSFPVDSLVGEPLHGAPAALLTPEQRRARAMGSNDRTSQWSPCFFVAVTMTLSIVIGIGAVLITEASGGRGSFASSK